MRVEPSLTASGVDYNVGWRLPETSWGTFSLLISASQLKVNPDASGEDLVKKVPGVTVENGQVKAHGENVQKVTIDGRELFNISSVESAKWFPSSTDIW